jgi:hypothetical protein
VPADGRGPRIGVAARLRANVEVTLTGPGGGTVSGRESDSHTGVSDL